MTEMATMRNYYVENQIIPNVRKNSFYWFISYLEINKTVFNLMRIRKHILKKTFKEFKDFTHHIYKSELHRVALWEM